MTKTTRYIDLGFCLTMAIVMHFVFPVHRWFSEAPLSAFLFLGFFFLTYAHWPYLCS